MDPAHNNNVTLSNGHPNQRARINRLSNEVLSMIFLLYNPEGQYSRKNMWRYLLVTWVCSRWRHLALGLAELWTLIDLSSRWDEPIKQALKRANEANLTIFHSGAVSQASDACPGEIDKFRRLIAPLMNRVVALELHLTRVQWKYILSIIKQPTPSLRHLVLRTSDNIPNPELKLHDLVLDKGQLHTLTYDMSYCLPWDCLPPLTRVLRELKLSVYKSSPDSLRQLFDFLKSCPELEHLDLQMNATYFPSMLQSTPTEDVADVPPTLTMPRLVKLTLHNTNDTYITDHLVTPRLRQCFITLDSRQLPPPDLCAFLANNLDISKTRELSIVTGSTNEFCFWGPSISPGPASRSGSGAGPDSGLLGVLLHPVLQLTFTWKGSYDSSIKPIYHFLIREASDLKKLVLRDIQPQPEMVNTQSRDDRWRGFGLPGPKTVILCGSQMRKFHYEILEQAHSIRDLVIESPDDILDILPLLEDPLLCPRITTLSFVGASGEKAFGRELLAMATSRKGKSAAMTQIQLLGCPPLANLWTHRLEKLGIDCLQP
ncbi:hypothetical protein JB92DRAFT_2838102 [Gautieria morchelliformis]|nr:hypothetical protein JB92DRAFT_2838102 [Gautieria morchelliformis]